MWRLACKWARHTHPNKSRRWVVARYFGMFNPSRNDRWMFGSRDTGFYLRQVRLDADRPAPDGRQERRHPTTRPWPNTGPSGVARSRPPVSAATCARSCAASTADARSAGGCCCTPTANRKTRASGSSGITATRKAIRKAGGHRLMDPARRTNTPHTASYTPTAAGRHRRRQGPAHCLPVSLQGLLEPSCRESGHGRF